MMSNFFFSHSVFYFFGELSTIFMKFEIAICKLFRIGRVYNMSFGEGLMQLGDVLIPSKSSHNYGSIKINFEQQSAQSKGELALGLVENF